MARETKVGLLLGLGVVFMFMCILQWRFGGRAHAELGAANTGSAVELTKAGRGDPGTACGSDLAANPGAADSAVSAERQLNIADVKNGLHGRNEDSVLMTTTSDSGTAAASVVPEPAATTDRTGPAQRGTTVLPEAGPPATTLDPGTASYTVKPGDNFAKIAKAQGLKLQDIAKLNPGIDSTKMKVGMKIVLPAKATDLAVLPGRTSLPTPVRDPVPTPTAGPKTYVVAAGDSLGSISAKMYGTCKKATLIASANKGINPNSLKVGTKLVIPAAPAATSPIAPAVAPSPAPATLDTDTMMAVAPRSHRTAPLAHGSVSPARGVEPLVDPSAYPERIEMPRAGATPPTTAAGGPAEMTTPGPAARALSRTAPTSPVASVVSMDAVR